MASSAEATRKLKVLVIHGYRQSEKTSREKTGALRKLLKKYAELVYITAPNEIAERLDESREEYGWWFSSPSSRFSALEDSPMEDGHLQSVDAIREAIAQHGPFDGLLGFSQGATMAAHMCWLAEHESAPSFKFAILCAGFKSRSSAHAKYYEQSIVIPSLHIYGDTDKVIARELSEGLESCFTDVTTICHAGGHYIPATSKEKSQYAVFLERFLK